MENYDYHDLLSQMDQTPQELYALHTKTPLFDSSTEHSESDESTTFDNVNKPPLITYEKLMANLVEYKSDDMDNKSIFCDNNGTALEGASDDVENRPLSENILQLCDIIAQLFYEEEPYYKETKDFSRIQRKLDIKITEWEVKNMIEKSETMATDTGEAIDAASKISDSEDRHKIASPVPLSAQEIANKLSRLLTSQLCLICHEQINETGDHYQQKDHSTAVKRWIDDHLKQLEKPVEMDLIFCAVCNLVLSGNELAKRHYSAKLHTENLKDYCSYCNERCEPGQYRAHLNSKCHLKQFPQIAEPTIVDLPDTSVQSYASALKGETLPDDESGNQEALKDYTNLADFLTKLFTTMYCYICNICVTPDMAHYKSQGHNYNLILWLIANRQLLALYNIDAVAELICVACRQVFCNSHVAQAHYDGDIHKSCMATFCKTCFNVYESLANHVCLNRHQVNLDELKNIKERVGFMSASMILASNLKLLFSPVYCTACRMNVNAFNPQHYLAISHISNVRMWLGSAMKSLQDVCDPSVVFCEPCGMVLCGTKNASLHYSTQPHFLNAQTYCVACMFRASPLVMIQHYQTLDHKLRWDNLHKGVVTPMPANNPVIQSLTVHSLQYGSPPMPAQVVSDNKIERFLDEIAPKTVATGKEEEIDKQIRFEVKRLLETLCVSPKLALERTLFYVKRFNMQLQSEISSISIENGEQGANLAPIGSERTGTPNRTQQ